MKNELKTLKDIKIRKPKAFELPYLDWYKEELKQEAIKWIKEFDKNILKSSDDANCPYCERRLGRPGNEEMLIRIVWIKHFFNITDEDLK